jgi:hypothetical protein
MDQQLEQALQQIENLQTRVGLLENSMFTMGKDARNLSTILTQLEEKGLCN